MWSICEKYHNYLHSLFNYINKRNIKSLLWIFIFFFIFISYTSKHWISIAVHGNELNAAKSMEISKEILWMRPFQYWFDIHTRFLLIYISNSSFDHTIFLMYLISKFGTWKPPLHIWVGTTMNNMFFSIIKKIWKIPYRTLPSATIDSKKSNKSSHDQT